MKDEIKIILEKLKDNIPIEEYRSEGTSDGLTHYEKDKDSWQYKLLDYITNLQEENKELKKKITFNEKSRRKMQQSLMEQIEIKNEGFKATVEELCETSEKLEQLQQENERLTAESTEWESKFYDMEDNFHNTNEEIERLKEELKNRPIVDFTFDVYKELENYKSRCENVQDLILNELSHLKANDEETWNKEFYDENNKLDYRKLCIEILNQAINLLDGGDE